MKRLLSVIMSVIMLLAFLGISASAQSDGSYEYILKDDGSVEITAYLGTEAYVEIPSKIENYSVTSISDEAFYGNEYMVDVIIPESVSYIGEYAFASCEVLESVSVPSSVVKIGFGAFLMCLCLENIYVTPGNPTYSSVDGILFSSDARTLFQYPANKSYTEYSVPEGTETLYPYSFAVCGNLREIVIPDSVTEIMEGAFAYCFSLEEITLSNSLESVEDDLFSGCSSLKKIDIPESVVTINRGSFTDCESLNTVTLPQNIASIGQGAFSGCDSLKSIMIPSSVSYIGSSAFGFDSDGNAYDDFKIYGYSASYAEIYADLHDIEFVSIGDAENRTGDANGDGIIDILDYAMLKLYLSGGSLSERELNSLDVNNDRAIDGFDLFYINLHINNVQLLTTA